MNTGIDRQRQADIQWQAGRHRETWETGRLAYKPAQTDRQIQRGGRLIYEDLAFINTIHIQEWNRRQHGLQGNKKKEAKVERRKINR